jgi:cysteine desulfurase / selenocysteine lyase
LQAVSVWELLSITWKKSEWTDIAEHEGKVVNYALARIRDIDGITLFGDPELRASVISFVFDDIHAHDVGTILDKQGIAVRTGHHCAQPILERFGVSATARASFSFYNNEEDADRLIDGLRYVKDFFS